MVGIMKEEITMSTAVAEKRLTTGNELEKLADYAKHLRLSREDEDDDDWADAPLTPEEEAQIEEGREEFARGEYLTLDELMEAI